MGQNILSLEYSGGDSLRVVSFTESEIAGFQFALEGIEIIDAYMPEAISNGFELFFGSNNIIVLSFAGAIIPSGNNILAVVFFNAESESICFETECFNDTSTNDNPFYECVLADSSIPPEYIQLDNYSTGLDYCIEGCFNESACNYLTNDSCEYPIDDNYNCDDSCGGINNAVEDECGICGGDGSSCAPCLGDVNEDYEINILDVVAGINIILEIDDSTEAQLWALDFNEDGDTNILDLVIMINAILDGDWECGEVDICEGLTEVELWGECYNIEETTELILSGSWDNIGELSGEIPPEIGQLTNLTYLDLSNNQLSGEIPPEIGNFTFLDTLNLSANQLTGEIPPEIGNLTNLTYLDLDYNQLTGEIPPEIGNLTNLTGLGLQYNQLTGEIPQEVCDLIESNNLNIDNILAGNPDLINTCE